MQRSHLVPLLGLLATGCLAASEGDENDGRDEGCVQCDGYVPGRQYVTVAFDLGVRSDEMWRETLGFAREIEQELGKPLHYTFFITTANYLIDPPQNTLGLSRGHLSEADARRQWAYTQMAINEGHEIGSHTVSHFDGGSWSAERWNEELEAFEGHVGGHLFVPRVGRDGAPLFPRWSCPDPLATASCDPVFPVYDDDGALLFESDGEASREAIDAGRLVPYRVVGIRAPYLASTDALLRTLAARGYRYDASRTLEPAWPRRTSFGPWEIPVQMMPRTTTTGAITGMDYNLFARHVTAAETESIYREALRRAYQGDRHPVHLCHHFQRYAAPDGRTYWSALQNAIREAARLVAVRFPSNRELAAILDEREGAPSPFVGTSCTSDAACGSLVGGFCLRHAGAERGTCSLPCDRFCPDRSGYAGTFCVSADGLEGAATFGAPLPAALCLPRAEGANGSCADLPTTASVELSRNGEPERTELVCAPAR